MMTSLWQKNEGEETAAQGVGAEHAKAKRQQQRKCNSWRTDVSWLSFPPPHCLYTEFKPCELYKVFASPSMGCKDGQLSGAQTVVANSPCAWKFM